MRPLVPAPPLMHDWGQALAPRCIRRQAPCPPPSRPRALSARANETRLCRSFIVSVIPATRRRLRWFVARLPAANKALCRGCATATAAHAFYSNVDNTNNIKPHSRSTQRARVIRCNSHPARWLHISRTAAAVATANTSLQWPQSTLGSAAAAPTAAHSCALRVTGQPHCKRGVAHAAHLVAAVAVKTS